MSGLVVDASVALSWCFPDEQTPLSLRVLDRLNAGESAVVPWFWSVEILNALLIGEKRGRISALCGPCARLSIPHHSIKYAGRFRSFAVLIGSLHTMHSISS